MRLILLFIASLNFLYLSAYTISNRTEKVLQTIRDGKNQEAIELLKRAAATNDVLAQYYIGRCYEFGVGLEKNDQMAFSMYRRAAERGFPPAMMELAICYRKGLGVDRNTARADEWQKRYMSKNTGDKIPDIIEVFASHESNPEPTAPLLAEATIKEEKKNVNANQTPTAANINRQSNYKSAEITYNQEEEKKSDVDHAIPRNSQLKSSNTFAVIIANERYDNVSQVPYAENDGNILSKYLTNTFGLPQEHVKLYNNATLGKIHGALKHIKDLSLAFGEKLNLIFYYAGHGVPNEQTKQCMLLPIDGDAQMPETCYEIGKLYSILGELNANSVIVIMDACFSGSLRGDGMLFASRGVRIKSKYAEPKGNMVIFSASQGDETAFPYDKEQHGLFTYYLLKCLQENKGNVTLGQLSEYLNEQVKQQSVVSNGKLQTPMVQSAPNVEEYWRSWKLVQ